MAVVLLALIVLFGGGVLALGWRASGHAMHPAETSYPWQLSDFPALKPENVTFESQTGVTLAGRFFQGSSPATIVLSHGYGGNQNEMLPLANALYQSGFSVFTYDMRGCGESEGEVTLGALEQQDLRSAVDYLVSRSDVDAERIGAYGFSMGGATTIMAAAEDPRLKAVVADSAWSNVHHWLRPSSAMARLKPNAPFSLLSLTFVEFRASIDLDTLRPGDVVRSISPRPVFLIHGADDAIVEPDNSQQIFSAAGDPKELWLVPGAGHGDTIDPGNAVYLERVVAFFRQSLQP